MIRPLLQKRFRRSAENMTLTANHVNHGSIEVSKSTSQPDAHCDSVNFPPPKWLSTP